MSVFHSEIQIKGHSLLTEAHNKRALYPAGSFIKEGPLEAPQWRERLGSIC